MNYLQNQSWSIEQMASTMEMDLEQHLTLMQTQMHISVGKVNKIKINNF
jgi:hypothetical protein